MACRGRGAPPSIVFANRRKTAQRAVSQGAQAGPSEAYSQYAAACARRRATPDHGPLRRFSREVDFGLRLVYGSLHDGSQQHASPALLGVGRRPRRVRAHGCQLRRALFLRGLRPAAHGRKRVVPLGRLDHGLDQPAGLRPGRHPVREAARPIRAPLGRDRRRRDRRGGLPALRLGHEPARALPGLRGPLRVRLLLDGHGGRELLGRQVVRRTARDGDRHRQHGGELRHDHDHPAGRLADRAVFLAGGLPRPWAACCSSSGP